MDIREKEEKLVQIIRQLKKVNYPGYSRDIVSFGFLKKLDIDEFGRVDLIIEVSTQKGEIVEEIKNKVESVLSEIGWISELNLTVKQKEVFTRKNLPIKGKSVVVYSTKGGVGKSTFAVNLAYTFSLLGFRTSLLDLDVHGPSIPKMTGTLGYHPFSPDGKHIAPCEKDGVRIMSIGYMADEGKPIVWRGPMVIKAFRTLVFSTLWPDTEILVMDMPPGSGDIQLSLIQEVYVDGVIMITTPQDVALEDVRRGINMFRELQVPILGVVENMSFFVCECGRRHYIFGRGGGERIAKDYLIELLGKIPIDPELMELSDRGKIFVLSAKDDSPAKKAFFEISKNVLGRLKIQREV